LEDPFSLSRKNGSRERPPPEAGMLGAAPFHWSATNDFLGESIPSLKACKSSRKPSRKEHPPSIIHQKRNGPLQAPPSPGLKRFSSSRERLHCKKKKSVTKKGHLKKRSPEGRVVCRSRGAVQDHPPSRGRIRRSLYAECEKEAHCEKVVSHTRAMCLGRRKNPLDSNRDGRKNTRYHERKKPPPGEGKRKKKDVLG